MISAMRTVFHTSTAFANSAGALTFVHGLLVIADPKRSLPTPEWFPDAWTSNEAGRERPEVEQGGASAIDREEVTLTVREDFAAGERSTRRRAHT
jgi:hypothetical protein